MSVTVTSTTDSKEAVDAVNGVLAKEPVVETKTTPVKSESVEEDDKTEVVEDESADETPEEVEAKAEKTKKKGGYQKKIDKQAAEIEFLKSQLAKPIEKTAPKESVIEKGKPNQDDFDTVSAFNEALFDWKYEQKKAADSAELAKKEALKEQKTIAEAHQSRVNEFMKKQTDYVEVINDFIEEHGELDFSEAMAEIIRSSELGPAVIYELVKDKKELDRINALSPLAAAREFGKIEARLAKPEKEPINKTNAPTPIKVIGSKGSAVPKKLDDPSLSQAEFERLRNEQRAKKQA